MAGSAVEMGGDPPRVRTILCRVLWGRFGARLDGAAGRTCSFLPAFLGCSFCCALLGFGLVRLAWVEQAAALFLWLLPLWLLPVFVSVAEDKQFWRREGPLFLGTVMVGLLILWGFVGHFAQFLFAKYPGDLDEPGPLTDAEQRRAAADVADEEVAS